MSRNFQAVSLYNILYTQGYAFRVEIIVRFRENDVFRGTDIKVIYSGRFVFLVQMYYIVKVAGIPIVSANWKRLAAGTNHRC